MTTKTKPRRTPKKTAKGKPAPGPETRMAEILALGSRWRHAYNEWQAAKDKSLEKKKTFDSISQEMMKLTTDEPMPLYDQEAGANGAGSGPAAGGPSIDDWKTVSIATLGLPAKTIAALADANIKTLGDLTDFQKDGVPLTQIKGIGQKAAEKIDKATEAFWESHPREQAHEVIKEAAEAMAVPNGTGDSKDDEDESASE